MNQQMILCLEAVKIKIYYIVIFFTTSGRVQSRIEKQVMDISENFFLDLTFFSVRTLNRQISIRDPAPW